MRWMLLLFLIACSPPPTTQECDWDWIDEETCVERCMELAPDDEVVSECRDGLCWCCTDEDGCWASGH